MTFQYQNSQTSSEFRLIIEEPAFDRVFFGRDRKDKLLTIAWNRGEKQQAMIDNVAYDFPANSILCLMVNETFSFSHPAAIVAWQFNRDFYCIVDHDKEVSCVGFLFFNTSQRMFVALNEAEQKRVDLLLGVFQEEFETPDLVQGEMLQVLLKRLIIIVTRLAKQQYLDATISDDKLDTIRKFNLLVENHYRDSHQVKFYADKLNKSPKTLSNLFALYNHQSPQMVIQERVLLEAKRLLQYTDKSAKEIANDIGFEDAGHFSKFFKKHTSLSPTELRSKG